MRNTSDDYENNKVCVHSTCNLTPYVQKKIPFFNLKETYTE